MITSETPFFPWSRECQSPWALQYRWIFPHHSLSLCDGICWLHAQPASAPPTPSLLPLTANPLRMEIGYVEKTPTKRYPMEAHTAAVVGRSDNEFDFQPRAVNSCLERVYGIAYTF